MTSTVLFLLALAQTAPLSPAAPTQVVVDGAGAPSFAIPRLEETVTVDGRLDEPAWSRATRLSGFSEYRPVVAYLIRR